MPPQKKPTKAERRKQAMAEAQRLRELQKAKEKRTRLLVILAVIAALIVVVVATYFIVKDGSKSSLEKVTQKPSAAQADGGIILGKDGVPVANSAGVPTVAVYSDFACHWCKTFDDTYYNYLKEGTTKGDLDVKYYFVATQAPGPTGYSTRSAAAVYLIAEEAPKYTFPMIQALFGEQQRVLSNPSVGLTNAELTQMAISLGVPSDVAAKFEKNPYIEYVTAVTANAAKTVPQKYSEPTQGKGLATPFILVNDIPLDTSYYPWTEKSELPRAVADAKEGKLKYSWTKIEGLTPGTPAPSEPAPAPQPAGSPPAAPAPAPAPVPASPGESAPPASNG